MENKTMVITNKQTICEYDDLYDSSLGTVGPTLVGWIFYKQNKL